MNVDGRHNIMDFDEYEKQENYGICSECHTHRFLMPEGICHHCDWDGM